MEDITCTRAEVERLRADFVHLDQLIDRLGNHMVNFLGVAHGTDTHEFAANIGLFHDDVNYLGRYKRYTSAIMARMFFWDSQQGDELTVSYASVSKISHMGGSIKNWVSPDWMPISGENDYNILHLMQPFHERYASEASRDLKAWLDVFYSLAREIYTLLSVEILESFAPFYSRAVSSRDAYVLAHA